MDGRAPGGGEDVLKSGPEPLPAPEPDPWGAALTHLEAARLALAEVEAGLEEPRPELRPGPSGGR